MQLIVAACTIDKIGLVGLARRTVSIDEGDQ